MKTFFCDNGVPPLLSHRQCAAVYCLASLVGFGVVGSALFTPRSSRGASIFFIGLASMVLGFAGCYRCVLNDEQKQNELPLYDAPLSPQAQNYGATHVQVL